MHDQQTSIHLARRCNGLFSMGSNYSCHTNLQTAIIWGKHLIQLKDVFTKKLQYRYFPLFKRKHLGILQTRVAFYSNRVNDFLICFHWYHCWVCCLYLVPRKLAMAHPFYEKTVWQMAISSEIFSFLALLQKLTFISMSTHAAKASKATIL